MKNLSHSELWINTDYFIQAIRCICSLTYLEEHTEICQLIDAKDFIDGKLHRFYINLCALVDIHCDCTLSNSKRPAYKKMLKTMCPSFDWIFYERDKNATHKDSNYVYKTNISLSDVIAKMKKAIKNNFDDFSIKLKRQEAQMNAFCEKTGLLVDNARVQKYGFGRSAAQKAVSSANKHYKTWSSEHNINNIKIYIHSC